MRCPFRTTTVTEAFNSKSGSVTTVEYAECLKHECPYFGKRVARLRTSGGFERVVEPVCRRIDNG